MGNMRSKKRARSEEEKEENLKKILEAGKELILDLGPNSLSMRNLANQLDMTQTFLYTYVESKRELWILIRRKYYQELANLFELTTNNHKGSSVQLILDLMVKFFDFAEEDFHRFLIMFIIPVPKSEKKGKIEENYEPVGILDTMKKILKNAMNNGEINKRPLDEYLYYLWSSVFGTAYILSIFNYRAPIMEGIQRMEPNTTKESFKSLAINEIKKILE